MKIEIPDPSILYATVEAKDVIGKTTKEVEDSLIKHLGPVIIDDLASNFLPVPLVEVAQTKEKIIKQMEELYQARWTNKDHQLLKIKVSLEVEFVRRS